MRTEMSMLGLCLVPWGRMRAGAYQLCHGPKNRHTGGVWGWRAFALQSSGEGTGSLGGSGQKSLRRGRDKCEQAGHMALG